MANTHALAIAAAFVALVAMAAFSILWPPNFVRTGLPEYGIDSREEVSAAYSTNSTRLTGELSTNAADPKSQANALVEILARTLHEFINNQTKLKSQVEELQAELNKAQNASAVAEERLRSEKAKIDELVAERDRVLVNSKQHASNAAKAATVELQALLENARRALIVERQRWAADQQKSEQVIQDLLSRLAVSERENEALNTHYEKLRAEHETTTRARAEAQAALIDMTSKFREATRKSQELSTEIARLEHSEKTRQAILAWQQFVKESEKLVSQYRPLIETTTQSLDSSEADLDRAKSYLTRTEESAKALSLELETLNDAVYEPERLTKRAAASIEQRFKTLVGAEITLHEILESAPILRSDLDEILQRLGAMEAQKQYLQSLIAEKAGFGKAAAQSFKTLDKEVADLDAVLASLEWRLSVVPEGETGKEILADIEGIVEATESKAKVFAARLINAAYARRRIREQADTIKKQASQFSEQVAKLGSDLRESQNMCDILAQKIQAHHLEIASSGGGDLTAAAKILNERKETLLASQQSYIAGTGDIDTAKENLQAAAGILIGLRTSLSEEAASLLEAQHAAAAARAKFEELLRPTIGESENAQKNRDLAPNSLRGDQWLPNNEERGAVAAKLLPFLKEIAEGRKNLENQLARVKALADTLSSLHTRFSNLEKSSLTGAETKKKLLVRYEQLHNQINALAERDRSLAERTRNQAKKVSEALARVSALKGHLSSLSSRNAAISEAGDPIGETSDAAAAESASITEWNGRLQSLRDRLASLRTSIQSQKSAQAVLNAREDTSPQVEVGSGNASPVGLPSADKGKEPLAATEIVINCNLSRPSCQRWVHLKRKRSRQANQGRPLTHQ